MRTTLWLLTCTGLLLPAAFAAASPPAEVEELWAAPEAGADAPPIEFETTSHSASCGGIAPVTNSCRTTLRTHCCSITGEVFASTPYSGTVTIDIKAGAHGRLVRSCDFFLGSRGACRTTVTGFYFPGETVTVDGRASWTIPGSWSVTATNR